MAVECLCLLLLSLLSQGYGQVTEITLEDQNVTHIGNPLVGTSFGIAKSWLDTLVSCHIVFPNNIIYEAYPQDSIPNEKFFFNMAVEPFRSCSIGLRGVSESDSGTYELFSIVDHSEDSSRSVTRRKFHLTVLGTDLEFPSK